jgi:hypothetical protein
VRQTRSRISSVLKLSTKLSAPPILLTVVGIPDGADRGEHAVVVEGLAVVVRRVLDERYSVAGIARREQEVRGVDQPWSTRRRS